jgi:hypothetical protein
MILMLAGLLVAAFVVPSFAWEFSMKGEYENRLMYWGSTGNNDLFGKRDVQDSGLPGAVVVGFAGPNIYGRGPAAGWFAVGNKPSSNLLTNAASSGLTQMAIVRGGYSLDGSDALMNDSRLTLKPTIRVNKAIRVFGVYNIGGFRNKYNMTPGGVAVPPFERYYMTQTSTNAYGTAAIGSWEQFRTTIYVPWGVFSIGVKDFPLGTGATLGYNTRAESFLTVVPYGPFRFLYAIWLGRGRGAECWSVDVDGTERNDFFQGFVVTYDNADLNIGLLAILRHYHGNNTATATALRDDNTQIYGAYFKYNNGRFFANAEYAWANVDRYRPTAAGNAAVAPANLGRGSGSQTIYVEAYHFFSEAGFVVGPLKFSAMYALASGPVLNTRNRVRNLFFGTGGGAAAAPGNAVLAPGQPGGNDKIYMPWAINWQAMEPYEYLMFNRYAGGNNGGWNILDVSFVLDDHGMMTDAYCFAGRLDYAVACNLNVWGSYIWAHRLERSGTYFGQYASDGTLALNSAGGAAKLARFYANAGRVAGVGADYVSDGFIGWELNLGCDWKLLEGLTFKTRYSYWQPGEWFAEAYQAVGIVGGAVDQSAVLETRDAIQAFQGSLLIEF